MKHEIEFKPRAIKDLKCLDSATMLLIITRIEDLRDGLKGDVKKLTKYTPEYRLRVGAYRVLFDLEDERVVVYRVLHRKDAYR